MPPTQPSALPRASIGASEAGAAPVMNSAPAYHISCSINEDSSVSVTILIV